MFQDVDETLRALLIADVPIDRTEVDITFDRPTREWSSRLTRPAVNLFLFDIRERTDFRDDAWQVRTRENGTFERTRAPRRVDLSYLVTAWTKEAEDEHRILGRVLPAMYRNTQVPPALLRGALTQTQTPVLARVMTSDHVAKPADFWGVMDNEFRVALTWVITAPLDVFAPQEGPLVTTAILSVGEESTSERERFVRVGGLVVQKGNPAEPVPFTRIQVMGTGSSATADAEGEFVFGWVPEGKQKWRIEAPGQEPFEVSMDVPSNAYIVEVPSPKKAK